MRIVFAGTPRSGSTWAANVLGQAAGVRTVYEPDGPFSDVLGAMVAAKLGDYPAVPAGLAPQRYRATWDLAFAGGWPWDHVEAARAAGRRMVKLPPAARDWAILALARATAMTRKRPEHVLVKTVNASLALEWLSATYRPRVVVLHRNPLNVVSSWMQLDMLPRRPLWDDPEVRRSLMVRLDVAPPPSDASEAARVAWTVGLLYAGMRQAVRRHPEWIVLSHDELCREPRAGFTELYGRLGLDWTEGTDAYLTASEDPSFTAHGGNAKAHPNAVTTTVEGESRRLVQATQYRRRLSPEQVAEVTGVLRRFDLGDWGVKD
ncbi:MAG TPA: sulfotransferase [Candidatus Angelobacter sp.]|jgi:hypothetical protein|nr:sulfotransferase [Candidatus Angelobacter sp.]